MKKLIANPLTNMLMLSALLLGMVIYSLNIWSEKMTSLIHTQKEKISQKNKFLKLEFEPKFILPKQNDLTLNSVFNLKHSIKLNSYQAIAYRKNNPTKARLLHAILKNNEQRKKFKYVMKKAEEFHLPTELALIPIIESEYKNKAVSPKGAAGIWQLMPGTARIFGVSNKQRFEMVPSTKAALKHFKDLYNEFGNWELAIAAYNVGDGKLNKALKKNPHAKTVKDLNLPHETKNYVISFFQLRNALKSYNT